jgi:hypothetical protein
MLPYNWKDGCDYCESKIDITYKVYSQEIVENKSKLSFLYPWFSCKLDATIRCIDNRIPPEKCPKRFQGIEKGETI